MNANIRHYDRLLAEAIPEGIIILKSCGALRWWNHVAKQLLELDHLVHPGKSIRAIIPHEDFFQLLKTKNKQEIKIASPYHPECFLSIRLRPYWENQQLLIISDITHRIRLENMRQNFLANVSHELRTPLTVLRGYLELFQDHLLEDHIEMSNLVEQMVGQSYRMQTLVENLLLLSQLESGLPDKTQYQSIQVAELLDKIYQAAKILSGEHAHQFELKLDKDLSLMGVSTELYSAFSNLIYNAVRYTPPKGKIKISWYQDLTGKHLIVEDTGIGIPAEDLPKLTQRYYRAKSKFKHAGTGLGLAIVQQVLLRHQGQLIISSVLNKGSIFHCHFTST